MRRCRSYLRSKLQTLGGELCVLGGELGFPGGELGVPGGELRQSFLHLSLLCLLRCRGLALIRFVESLVLELLDFDTLVGLVELGIDRSFLRSSCCSRSLESLSVARPCFVAAVILNSLLRTRVRVREWLDRCRILPGF